MHSRIKQLRDFLKKHERYIMPITLVLGFVVDYLTLNRVDQVFDNIVLFVYVTLTGVTLFFIYAKDTFKKLGPIAKYYDFLPFIFQYALGGLFSGLLIFYFRSGALITSFPFIITLLVLMLGNEYFYKRFPKITFQLVIFFIALVSYTNLLVPVVMKHMGVTVFLFATLLGTALMYAYLQLLRKYAPALSLQKELLVERRLVATLVIFLLLYFTNVIPPLPLSMKTGVIGHSVVRTNDTYTVSVEDAPWYRPFATYSSTIHTRGSVYAFTAIFAPADLETQLFHQWAYYDENAGWVDVDRIPIRITGGREQGFRGYSTKSNVRSGDWRVDTETTQGQIVGRLRFTVKHTQPQNLKEINY